jgi:hypothetical protein
MNRRHQGRVFSSHSRLRRDGSSQPTKPMAAPRSPCFYGRRNNVRDRGSAASGPGRLPGFILCFLWAPNLQGLVRYDTTTSHSPQIARAAVPLRSRSVPSRCSLSEIHRCFLQPSRNSLAPILLFRLWRCTITTRAIDFCASQNSACRQGQNRECPRLGGREDPDKLMYRPSQHSQCVDSTMTKCLAVVESFANIFSSYERHIAGRRRRFDQRVSLLHRVTITRL